MDFVEEDAILASGVVNATGEEDDEVDHRKCLLACVVADIIVGIDCWLQIG